MLGLVGQYLLDYEDNKNHLTVHPETLERINLNPWYVTSTIPATKDKPEKVVVYRPANEEDFQAFLKVQGPNNKNPLVGVLPDHVAKVKKAMYDKAIADYAKKEVKA